MIQAKTPAQAAAAAASVPGQPPPRDSATPPPEPPPARRVGRVLGWILALVVVAAVAAVAFLPPLRDRLRSTVRAVTRSQPVPARLRVQPSEAPRLGPGGAIILPSEALERLGVTFAAVEPQIAPIPLEISGTTAYNPSTLSRIRSRFDALVSKVHASIGQSVKKGDLLVELFSTELAQAKGTYLLQLAQWEHDSAQLKRQKPLFENQALSEKDYYDTVNDERKSRLEYKVARDNLVVYGLTDEEIEKLPDEDGSRRGWMTLRSPVDGLVIDRDVAEGNLYDEKSMLMTIAPKENLWVVGNVYESDQGRVSVGQDWIIRFPFLGREIRAKIEQIDPRIDPSSKTVSIRTTITDTDPRLKADMLVQGEVLIPSRDGQTTAPRGAVVVTDNDAHVYVRATREGTSFLRRSVDILKESHDRVIVSRGLLPGEIVVDRGSLLLDQIDEDLNATEPPPPANPPGTGHRGLR